MVHPTPVRGASSSIEEASGAYFLGLGSDITQPDLVGAVRSGLSFEALERLQTFLKISIRRIGEALSISERTLVRRKKNGRLTPEESDRLLRLARLTEMALVVFEENEESARRWMMNPKTVLGGESPLERVDTEAGAREVEDMLYVIEFTTAA